MFKNGDNKYLIFVYNNYFLSTKKNMIADNVNVNI